jgi:hypothetical protein
MATVAEQLGKKRMRRPVPLFEDNRPDPAQRVEADVHSRIGIGLPMSNIYARWGSPLHVFGPPSRLIVETRHRYFGGSLELVSLDGWGKYRLFPDRFALLIVLGDKIL